MKRMQEPRVSKALAESVALADQACREIRSFSYLLHPPLLDEAGLAEALRGFVEGFAQRTKIQVDLRVSPELKGPPHSVETTLYRLVQECLTNIHRHSGSPTAQIRLLRNHTQVILEVADRGRGISPLARGLPDGGPVTFGVGIRGMRERVRQLGGSLDFDSANPGTIVRAVLPVSGASP